MTALNNVGDRGSKTSQLLRIVERIQAQDQSSGLSADDIEPDGNKSIAKRSQRS